MSDTFRAGLRVRLKSAPARIGVLSGERLEHNGRVRWEVHFPDGSDFVPELAIEPASEENLNPFVLMRQKRFGHVRQLRSALTYYRLSGRLADLIYSLNTTNTNFYAYQFKPVLHFLDSPARGLLIADEVGLGKTIEAGLIWTELRSRMDARRLLVVCPALLREKWARELRNRFGIEAQICSADDVLTRLRETGDAENRGFALIASLQGLRPPAGWRDDEDSDSGPSARLARFLAERADDEPLLDLVIIDEAHYLRNPETQTARLGRLIRPVADAMLLLSATPIQLKSEDLFQLLHLLDEDSFPFHWSFESILRDTEPLIRLRDRLLGETISADDFRAAIREARGGAMLGASEVLQELLDSPPSGEELASAATRIRLADRIDRINPLSKVVSRTRKRDVHERRVVREVFALRMPMSQAEGAFYADVTEKVREHCGKLDIAEGFLLTIPQRQICSSMPAAIRSWKKRADDIEIDEIMWEAFGSEAQNGVRQRYSPLMTELAGLAKSADYELLKDGDSKFNVLWDRLSEYWKRYPDAKVVLFAYFRDTLHYLSDRLLEKGVQGALLMGGMDKDMVLAEFEKREGSRILLSSEVASEGVDLQFSSLLINYDIPWNPMRIEQRIGRIDRIGQLAEKILVWNLFCENTLDDRVYTRLLERLNIFERALGAGEAILGADIRAMSYELLRHHLTPEQEAALIDQTRLAVEQNSQIEEELEREAARLVAHGDYVQQKINAARELGRFISNEDLYSYVKDFCDIHYPGCQFVRKDGEELMYEVELSAEARSDFAAYLEAERLQGRTGLCVAGGGRRVCVFENRLQPPRNDRDVISQYHPIVGFIGGKLRSEESARIPPVTAVDLNGEDIPGLTLGTYVFAVQRWSVTAERSIERLAFACMGLDASGRAMDPDAAERLVNAAAGRAGSWINASGEIDGTDAERVLLECVQSLDARFSKFVSEAERESRDRIHLQLDLLRRYEERKSQMIRERLESLASSGKTRVLPALQGQLKKLQQKTLEKRLGLERKLKISHESRLASAGVARIH